LPAATRRCASGEEHLADKQRSRLYCTSSMCTEARFHAAMYLQRGGVAGRHFGRTYVIVVPRPLSRPLPAATRPCRSRRKITRQMSRRSE
jgi:hypothetical protein